MFPAYSVKARNSSFNTETHTRLNITLVINDIDKEVVQQNLPEPSVSTAPP